MENRKPKSLVIKFMVSVISGADMKKNCRVYLQLSGRLTLGGNMASTKLLMGTSTCMPEPDLLRCEESTHPGKVNGSCRYPAPVDCSRHSQTFFFLTCSILANRTGRQLLHPKFLPEVGVANRHREI